jgi:hypothetical protein
LRRVRDPALQVRVECPLRMFRDHAIIIERIKPIVNGPQAAQASATN